jgi:hypothetical protein
MEYIIWKGNKKKISSSDKSDHQPTKLKFALIYYTYLRWIYILLIYITH